MESNSSPAPVHSLVGPCIPALDDIVGNECNCEFTPYDDGDTEESFHFKRRCIKCNETWFSLHCPHDGHQNPCPHCGHLPIPRVQPAATEPAEQAGRGPLGCDGLLGADGRTEES